MLHAGDPCSPGQHNLLSCSAGGVTSRWRSRRYGAGATETDVDLLREPRRAPPPRHRAPRWLRGRQPTAEVLHWRTGLPASHRVVAAAAQRGVRWYGADATRLRSTCCDVRAQAGSGARLRSRTASPCACGGRQCPARPPPSAAATPTPLQWMPTSPTLLLTAPAMATIARLTPGGVQPRPRRPAPQSTRCCAAHCTAALLVPAALATEHTRYARFVQDRYGVPVDAFSGPRSTS